MSSKQSLAEPKKLFSATYCYQRAILRACGDEPLLRYVSKREDGIIMVKSDRTMQRLESGIGGNDWIGWPMKDVYPYNPSTLEMLSRLYSEEKNAELIKAWNGLTPLFNQGI